jgi:virginiamycin B lyase
MRARIAVASFLVLLTLGGPGAIPAAAGHPAITEFHDGLIPKSHPWDLADGGDGSLWFTQESLRAFGSITAGDGLVSEFRGLLILGDHPKGITRGPDGNIWIAQPGSGGAIARVTSTGAVKEFVAGSSSSQPWDIAAGPDGNLWFVSRDPAFIGRITPDGTITEFTTGLTPKSQPTAITAGLDGNMWFTESADPGRIGRITPEGVITESSIGLTPKMVPTDITAGTDGKIWFTLSGDPGAIGTIATDGEITEFREGLTRNSRPTGIATGTDGAIWFTESANPGRIGRITKSGEITEYTDGLTADRSPWRIAPGPDGNMWFTENSDPGSLARVSLPPTVRTRTVDGVTDDTALLRAKVRPNAQVTEFHFEYREGDGPFSRTRSESAGAGWDSVDVSAPLAELKPGTTYRFRVVATNDSGSTSGHEVNFTTAALEPQLGEALVAHPKGRVRFKRPGGRWRKLPRWGAELPVGVALDTRRGSVRLTSMVGGRRAQSGVFGGGVVRVRQPKRAGGRVDLHLRGGNFARCPRPARRAAAGVGANASYIRRDPVRRLWGRDRGGRFRTFGRHSQATVRGTRWLTKDTCAGTLTVVTRGAVLVRDFARHRNVLVRAGHRYLAHARLRR